MFDLPETITIWNIASNDGFGDKTWDGPHTYSSRNALKQEKFTDINGDQKMSVAVSYSKGSLVQLDSKLYFGTSVSATPEPTANDVRAISQTPSGAGDLKKVWLV